MASEPSTVGATKRAEQPRALVGFTYGHDSEDWQASALRLIDILMTGLRRPPVVLRAKALRQE